ncbi:hypothetical protein LINGRAHAP2_LOCUS5380 [Linum grandiflorum]
MNEAKIQEPRRPLKRDAPDPWEPPGDDLRRVGVAVSDEDVGPQLSFSVVPVLADEGG